MTAFPDTARTARESRPNANSAHAHRPVHIATRRQINSRRRSPRRFVLVAPTDPGHLVDPVRIGTPDRTWGARRARAQSVQLGAAFGSWRVRGLPAGGAFDRQVSRGPPGRPSVERCCPWGGRCGRTRQEPTPRQLCQPISCEVGHTTSPRPVCPPRRRCGVLADGRASARTQDGLRGRPASLGKLGLGGGTVGESHVFVGEATDRCFSGLPLIERRVRCGRGDHVRARALVPWLVSAWQGAEVLCSFVYSRVAVLVRHWFEIGLTNGVLEHGARLELRLLEPQTHRGTESAAQRFVIDRPVWRADLFDRLDRPAGTFSAAHFHPRFNGDRAVRPGLPQRAHDRSLGVGHRPAVRPGRPSPTRPGCHRTRSRTTRATSASRWH